MGNGFCFLTAATFATLLTATPSLLKAEPQLVTGWSGYTHPLSYQGRVLTRDSKGNYFAIIRSGSDVNVWKRDATSGSWSKMGAVNGSPLSGREGECGSIAVDGKDQVHVVYYDGSAPDLAHKVAPDGKAFTGGHVIQSGVTWNATAAGGPFLHVAKDGSLHVAFINEDGEKPYHAVSRDGGGSWKVTKVSDQGGSNLRPSVITLPAGRIIVGFSAPSFHASFSDNGGANWTAANPPSSGATSNVNCRLVGNGDDVYVTGQKTDPTPRAIVVNSCNGTTMKWGAWETIAAGTGADASLVLDAKGNRIVFWRQYPNSPNSLFYSSSAEGWERKSTDAPQTDYLLPYAYWQEFHRGNPSANSISLLAPDKTNSKIYFVQIQAEYLVDSQGATITPKKNPESGATNPKGKTGWQRFDLKGQEIASGIPAAGFYIFRDVAEGKVDAVNETLIN